MEKAQPCEGADETRVPLEFTWDAFQKDSNFEAEEVLCPHVAGKVFRLADTTFVLTVAKMGDRRGAHKSLARWEKTLPQPLSALPDTPTRFLLPRALRIQVTVVPGYLTYEAVVDFPYVMQMRKVAAEILERMQQFTSQGLPTGAPAAVRDDSASDAVMVDDDVPRPPSAAAEPLPATDEDGDATMTSEGESRRSLRQRESTETSDDVFPIPTVVLPGDEKRTGHPVACFLRHLQEQLKLPICPFRIIRLPGHCDVADINERLYGKRKRDSPDGGSSMCVRFNTMPPYCLVLPKKSLARAMWTSAEEGYLLEGLELKLSFEEILEKYPFNPSRNVGSLTAKSRLIEKQAKKRSIATQAREAAARRHSWGTGNASDSDDDRVPAPHPSYYEAEKHLSAKRRRSLRRVRRRQKKTGVGMIRICSGDAPVGRRIESPFESGSSLTSELLDEVNPEAYAYRPVTGTPRRVLRTPPVKRTRNRLWYYVNWRRYDLPKDPETREYLDRREDMRPFPLPLFIVQKMSRQPLRTEYVFTHGAHYPSKDKTVHKVKMDEIERLHKNRKDRIAREERKKEREEDKKRKLAEADAEADRAEKGDLVQSTAGEEEDRQDGCSLS